MSVFQSLRWSALAAAFGLTVSAAQAEMITPDSVPNPPSSVASANGTPVYANNVVTAQYAGMGLDFSGDAAITRLNGVSVWVPVEPVAVPTGGTPGNSPVGMIDYYQSGLRTAGTFVSLGSLNPTTVSSLTVETIGGEPQLFVYGRNGQLLNIPPILQSYAGPHGGEVWTFTGAGIASFSGFTSPIDSMGQGNGPIPNPWGIAEISFTPATAPEPSSLVLAGLGALGMAARFGWRRVRTTT